MKNDSLSKRRAELMNSLSLCDNDEQRVSILVDLVLQLQDNIFDLEFSYNELLFKIRHLTECAPTSF